MKLWFVLGMVALTFVPACGGSDDDGSGGSSGSSGTGAASGGGAGGSGGATGGTSSGGAAGSSTGGTTATGGAAGSGGSTATGGAAGAGGTSTGGTGGASACNTLTNDGPDIPETAESGTPPTMTGGTIGDGTYVLSARKDWQGSCNCTTRQKISVSGTTLQIVAKTGSAPEQRMTAGIATAGNKLTLSVACPATQSLPLEYTATTTEIQIHDPKDQLMSVFTKK